MNPGTWRRNRPRVKDFWRHRESGWRKQRIYIRQAGGKLRLFNRHDYRSAWVSQRGVCGFCDRPLSVKKMVVVDSSGIEVGVGRGISVEHDHKTTLFRSLTHGICNRAIGSHTLRSTMRLADYLERYRAEEEGR